MSYSPVPSRSAWRARVLGGRIWLAGLRLWKERISLPIGVLPLEAAPWPRAAAEVAAKLEFFRAGAEPLHLSALSARSTQFITARLEARARPAKWTSSKTLIARH